MNRFQTYLAGAAASLAIAVAATAAFADPAIEKTVKSPSPGIYEIALNQAKNELYVAAPGGRGAEKGFVLVLDAATLDEKSRIDVTSDAAYGLGFNEKTQTLYSTNTRADSVSAIDVATGKITTIKGKEGAFTHGREVVVDEDSNTIYVSMMGGRNGQTGKVWVIDGATNTLKEEILDVGLGVTGLVLDKEGNRLFATDMTANQVVAVDLEKKRVAGRWPTGGETPINLDYDPQAKLLYIANQGSATVGVVSTEFGAVVDTIYTGNGPLGIRLSKGDGKLYVANRQSGTTSVIDTRTRKVVASLATGTLPQTVAVDPRSNTAYVSNKARTGGRDAPPVEDPNGDTIAIIRP
ncbi:MAG: YncE family protein [Rhizobiaceae bacterium]